MSVRSAAANSSSAGRAAASALEQIFVRFSGHGDGPLLDSGDFDDSSADGLRPNDDGRLPSPGGLDLDRVGMIRLFQGSDVEADVQAQTPGFEQRSAETLVLEGPTHESGGHRQIHGQGFIGRGVRTGGVEGAPDGDGLLAEHVPDEPRDAVAARGMGARRAAHDRAQDVVENADEAHGIAFLRRRSGIIIVIRRVRQAARSDLAGPGSSA